MTEKRNPLSGSHPEMLPDAGKVVRLWNPGKGNITDAWIDIKGLIDYHWAEYPRHQGTTDVTEVIEFPRIAYEHNLSNRQYDSLINRAQKYLRSKYKSRNPDAGKVVSLGNPAHKIGEYYVDYDEKTGLWCVFHTDYKSGHAFACYSSEEDAMKQASMLNYYGPGKNPGAAWHEDRKREAMNFSANARDNINAVYHQGEAAAHLRSIEESRMRHLPNPRPPKEWFTNTKRILKKQYGRNKANLDRIAAGIWWRKSEADRKALIKRYDNPDKAWHKSKYDEYIQEWLTSKDIYGRNAPFTQYHSGLAGAEAVALAKYDKKRNPIYKRANKGIGLLGIAAIAGIAYLIWKNRK